MSEVSNELVSIVIPVYNGERYIGRTLQSVAEQSHRNLEILIVDDGSTDGTGEILNTFVQQETRARILRQSNKGVAAARNLGIRAASGDFIAPLDADDIWHPERVSRQLRCLLDSPSDVGLVYSPWITIDESGRRLSSCLDRGRFEGIVWLQLVMGNFLGNASTALIKKDCLQAVGLYDEEYFLQRAQGCEDWDLYLRIAGVCRFHCQPDCLIGYRQVHGSMSIDVEQMMRSYSRLMSKVRVCGVPVPPSVYRWSRANYLLYMANRAAAARRRGLTAIVLLRLLSTDIARVLDRQLWRLLSRALSARDPSRRGKGGEVQSTTDVWGNLPRASTRRALPSGVLWNRVRQHREDRVFYIQQAMKWPVRLDSDRGQNPAALV
jgi:glycosyltransferase involved in cell wall biosynthesis